MIYVFVGIALQYLLGLVLALLAVQRLPGRRFFRVVFLHPADDHAGRRRLHVPDDDRHRQGPGRPSVGALGLPEYTWVERSVGGPHRGHHRRRLAVDRRSCSSSCWPPSRAQDQEVVEAALVDGATRWQSFLSITLPAILPVEHDDHPHPADRELQDHRHAEHPDRRRPGDGDPVADAPGLPRLANAQPRAVGSDRVHAAHRGHDRRHRCTSRSCGAGSPRRCDADPDRQGQVGRC